MKYFLGMVGLFLLSSPAFAAGHTYTCSDSLFAAGTASGCTSVGDFNMPGGGAGSYSDTVPIFPINDSQTYYVSYTYTGSTSGNVWIIFNGDNRSTFYNISSGTSLEVPVSVGTINPGGHVIFYSNQDGTLSNWCVDDDGTSCSSPTPPPYVPPVNPFGPESTSTPYNPFVDASGTPATISVIDNPTQDLANGFFIFYLTMFGIIWVFKKK